ASTAPLEADFRAEPRRPLVDLYVVVLAVDGLEPGRYRYEAGTARLVRIGEPLERRSAALLGLGQDLAGDAAADLYVIGDLERITKELGDRGYRAASLEGGISGGSAYLAAYALGLGATGLTFFDDEVAAAFGLDPERYGILFLTAVGVPATKPKRRVPTTSGQ
ncbi:MAG: SagB/ThcOx family dehydrogenase, partial [Candidatus Binatia bacterium]